MTGRQCPTCGEALPEGTEECWRCGQLPPEEAGSRREEKFGIWRDETKELPLRLPAMESRVIKTGLAWGCLALLLLLGLTVWCYGGYHRGSGTPEAPPEDAIIALT